MWARRRCVKLARSAELPGLRRSVSAAVSACASATQHGQAIREASTGPLSPPTGDEAGRGVKPAPSLANEMKAKGFLHGTPNFGSTVADLVSTQDAGAEDEKLREMTADLTTVNAVNVDFVRDLHGPWLIMTDDLQGELFIDHDRFVFYRPANGLGYGIGTIDAIDAKESGCAFTMKLETYAYEQTATIARRHGVLHEVTGMVKKVSSPSTSYETFSLVGIFRKSDAGGAESVDDSAKGFTDSELTTGQFNAAKLSPWTPTEKDAPWKPNDGLLHVMNEVFPSQLRLTSHVKRRDEAAKSAKMQTTSNASLGSSAVASGPSRGPFHLDLEKYRVGSVPSVYYIPDYISEEEESQILEMVKHTPPELKSKIQKRTVQEWGCTMCEECEKSFVSDANMPAWVQQCTDMLMYDGIFTPSTFLNSVRVHEYEPGEGIGPHCDGPIYVPCVTVLSLASTSVMNFYPRREPYFDHPMDHYNDTFKFAEGAIGQQTPLFSTVMEPRSLLVFADTAYYYYPHGVSDKTVDVLSPDVAGEVINRHHLRQKDISTVERQYRVSLTTRNLLTRCNHQPSRAEYNMKRSWYLYNQMLPLPDPVLSPSPLLDPATQPMSSTAAVRSATPSQPLTDSQLHHWEAKMDRVFRQQADLLKAVNELKDLLSATIAVDASFRKDTSTVLNNLTSSVLDMDAKLEDIQEELENSKPGKEL